MEDFLGTRPLRLRSGSLIAEVVDRAAERSRSSTGGILFDGGPFDCAQGAWAGEGGLGIALTGLEGFYDFGGFVKIWEGQFFCKAVVHFGCGFGFHGDAGQDRDVEFL